MHRSLSILFSRCVREAHAETKHFVYEQCIDNIRFISDDTVLLVNARQKCVALDAGWPALCPCRMWLDEFTLSFALLTCAFAAIK